MASLQNKSRSGSRGKWGVVLFLICLAIFMYVSIIYKIVNYGA